IDATEFDSNRKIDAPLQGDIKSVMQKLNSAAINAGVKAPTDWINAIKTESEKNNTKFAKRISASEAKSTLGYYSAIEPINDLMQKHPDTYLVSEGANTLDIGRDLIGMQKPRHRLDTGTWGVMGVGMGYAIAAAIETGKPVIALEGDSAFGFDGMEMETICRYHLPVIVVIINNGGIYNGDVNVVPDQPGPTVLDHNAHYGDISKAFGGDSYRVNNYEEMKDALEKAYESGNPTIIDAQIPESMGKESGHIGNLNPKLDLSSLEAKENK
ncbi:MAG: thiamine pyrophosphate-dependent enzyme, partial [Lactobacillus acidophilus]